MADLGDSKRSLLLARIAAKDLKALHQISAKLQIDAQLFARRLVPRAGDGRIAKPSPLEDAARAAYLQETKLIDFSSPAFQQWLDQNRLRRGPGECQVDYARRVFTAIRKGFRYTYTSQMDRHASHICRAGASDCGGLSILFVSALRAHGVPARLLVGRWALSANKGQTVGDVAFYQQHAKAEFYAEGVGWTPADLSSAVLHDKTPQGLTFFGDDKGDFIAMHIDHDLRLDTFHFGKVSLPWLQGIAYWVTGSGTLDGVTVDENWQVR